MISLRVRGVVLAWACTWLMGLLYFRRIQSRCASHPLLGKAASFEGVDDHTGCDSQAQESCSDLRCPGYQVAPNWLAYGKLSWHHAKAEYNDTDTGPGTTNHTGTGVGLGLATSFSKNIEGRFEVEQVNFSREARYLSKGKPKTRQATFYVGYRFWFFRAKQYRMRRTYFCCASSFSTLDQWTQKLALWIGGCGLVPVFRTPYCGSPFVEKFIRNWPLALIDKGLIAIYQIAYLSLQVGQVDPASGTTARQPSSR